MNNSGCGIQLGVSLYSLTGEYIKGELTLEDCLRTVAGMGFKGVEIVAAQMVPEYPHPSDRWLYRLRDAYEKYGLVQSCYSAYIDYGLKTERDLTREEILQFTFNDMVYAKKAGFKMVRTQHSISPELLEAMLPMCEKLDMMLTVEMHHPHHPHVPVWEKYIELMQGRGRGYLGVVPDFSIFQKKPHKLLVKRLLNAGFRADRLEALLNLHEAGAPLSEAQGLGLNEEELVFAEGIYEKFSPTSLDELERLIPISPYIHGKFYWLENGEGDDCIPYDKILPKIKALGYTGFIAAEYEGHHFDLGVDAGEQLRRYASVFNKYLG